MDDLVGVLLPLLVTAAVLGSASAFTTGLVTQDDITEPLRELVWRHFPRKGQRSPVPALEGDGWEMDRGTFLGNLIACYRCFGWWSTSVWVIAWVVAMFVGDGPGIYGLGWFAALVAVGIVWASACTVQRAWNAHT